MITEAGIYRQVGEESDHAFGGRDRKWQDHTDCLY